MPTNQPSESFRLFLEMIPTFLARAVEARSFSLHQTNTPDKNPSMLSRGIDHLDA